MSTTEQPPPKKDVMLALLERSSVFIHLDPRRDDVRVPQWFKKQPQLVLQVGLNMAVRIPDLDVGDDAVSCTLSFNRSPVFCYMPWTAVFALVAEDGKGMVWPNDIPKEVAAQQAERAHKEQTKADLRPVPDRAAKTPKPKKADGEKPAAGTKKRGPPRLRAEKSPDESTLSASRPEPAASPGPATSGKRPLPSYLRVVK